MRRIGRTSAVLVAAMAGLSFSAVAVSAASAATVHPSSHALKASSSVAPEAAAQASASASVSVSASALVVIHISAPELAAGAIICGGDVCAQGFDQVNNEGSIKAWANTTTFTGHFEIVNVVGNYANSPTKKWIAGGAGFVFTYEPLATSYNIDAWKGTKAPYTKIGTAQITLGL
jgi:hypothetical protein